MTDQEPTQQTKTPLSWIQLELMPLPHLTDTMEPLLVWWNPDERQVVGEDADKVLALVEKARKKGATGPNESVEVSDPLSKPTELAAILGEFYWVLPQPVIAPGERVAFPDDKDSASVRLQ